MSSSLSWPNRNQAENSSTEYEYTIRVTAIRKRDDAQHVATRHLDGNLPVAKLTWIRIHPERRPDQPPDPRTGRELS